MDQSLTVEWVKPSRLQPNPANPRVNDPAVPHVAASLSRFGWQQPIVARPSGEIVAGHTRLKAAEKLGMDEVPVIWFQGSDLDAAAYNVADNKTHDFSSWDDASLASILQVLKDEDALEGVGFSDAEVAELLAQLDDSQPTIIEDPGPDEPPEHPVSQPGDLWILGEHRLLCGDSTNLPDVKRVMGNDLANLVATDPPYLVDYTGERPNDSGKDWTATYREVDIHDADEFFRSVFTNVLEVLALGGHLKSGQLRSGQNRPVAEG